ncbi:MAG: response regulator [Syntrophobacteraceae bacterium]
MRAGFARFPPHVTVYSAEFLARFALSFFAMTLLVFTYGYIADRAHCELSARHKELAATISELRAKESALKESEEKYRHLVEGANDGVVVIQDGLIEYVNPKVAEITGRDAKESIGVSFGEFIPQPLPGLLTEPDGRGGDGGPSRYEVELKLANGEAKQVELTVGRTKLRGRPADLVFLRDITERKNYELQLREATLAAQAASKAKSQFLANMSHEIRTPMNGILGLAELLLSSELTPHQRDLAKTVLDSGVSLLQVLNDILDFSKIEAGRLELDRVEFNLRDTIEESTALFAEQAYRKGLELLCHVRGDVPILFESDPIRLRQVLTNLLGNAIKFTEKGEVLLEVRSVENLGDISIIGFEVRDTGVGIPPEKQARIFDPFSQADGSLSRKYGGTGLGLTICRQLCEMMGGRIAVRSSPGRGSTFAFQVQLKNSRRSPLVRDALPAVLKGVRVLIASENENRRRILDEQLRWWGTLVSSTGDASNALEELRRSNAKGEPFEAAILDTTMGGIDGFELAEGIKADSSLPQTKLIVLTGFGQQNCEAAERLGVMECLSKPTGQVRLYNALVGKDARAAGQPGSFEETTEGMRFEGLILLAEDNLINQKFAKAVLEGFGLEVEIASNGREVLEALGKRRYNLILMDCQMPEMDGYEASLRIRQNEAAEGEARIPIVALTAHALEQDREICASCGMDDYLSKPFSSKQLAAVLSRWLKTGSKEETKAEASEKGRAVIDVNAALERLGGDEELFSSLVFNLVEMCRKELPKIRTALQNQNFTRVGFLAHSLKGAAATLGANALEESAGKLELAIRQGVVEGLEELMTKLEQSGTQTMIFVRELPVAENGATFARGDLSPSAEVEVSQTESASAVEVFTDPDQAMKHLRQMTKYIKEHDPIGTRESFASLAGVLSENGGKLYVNRLSTCLSEYDFDGAKVVVDALLAGMENRAESF